MTPKGTSVTAYSVYRESAPPDRLARHICCFWTQLILGSGECIHRVLPDACVDIIYVNDAPPLVVGPATTPFLARLQAGTKIFGARFRPGRAANVLGVPAMELLNESVPLGDILTGSRGNLTLLQNARATPDAWSALIEVLVQGTGVDSAEADLVGESVRWLAQHPSGRVRELSQLLGVGDRQLRRRLSAAIGYGPKVLQSVLRFQRVLHLAGSPGRSVSLSYLAADAGYADQAHMTRAIRRFAHCTPTVLLRSSACTLRMSDLFKTGRPA